jgi:hypothetical protein
MLRDDFDPMIMQGDNSEDVIRAVNYFLMRSGESPSAPTGKNVPEERMCN